jgi:hypothetical protein
VDDEANVIVLCPNHHVQFDCGAMAIDPGTRRVWSVDPAYRGEPLRSGRQHGVAFLEYAWQRIYSADAPRPAPEAA